MSQHSTALGGAQSPAWSSRAEGRSTSLRCARGEWGSLISRESPERLKSPRPPFVEQDRREGSSCRRLKLKRFERITAASLGIRCARRSPAWISQYPSEPPLV